MPRVKACDQGPLRRNYVRFVLANYKTMGEKELRKTVKNLADMVVNPPKKKPYTPQEDKNCVVCKERFTPAWQHQISCSDKCALERKREMNRLWRKRMIDEGVF